MVLDKMAENRQDRLLMRQRGAGTRQIKDLDFELVLPGVPGIVTLPPKARESEISRQTAEAKLSPQRSFRNTPQPTSPLPQISSTPIAPILQKRNPGRPSKPRLAPTVNQTGIPNSIPTQSDGEGSVTKKRRVALKSSDQAKKSTKGITITESLETKESPTAVDHEHVSQQNDANSLSPAKSTNGREKSESVGRPSEKETHSRQSDDPREGENQLQAGIEDSGPVKLASQALNEALGSDIKTLAEISGQHSQIEPLSGIEKVAQHTDLRDGEESIIKPPMDLEVIPRPTRRKRKFIGEVQRFASEATKVLETESSAAMAAPPSDEVGQRKAKPQIPKPRGPRNKVLSVIGQENTAENILPRKPPVKRKLDIQPSQMQGRLENQPRKRGRPKKIVPPVSERGDSENITYNVRLNGSDLGRQQSQIRTGLGKLPTETEEQPQTVNLHGNSSLQAQEQARKISPPLGTANEPLNKSYNANLDEIGVGTQIIDPLGHPLLKNQRRLRQISCLQGKILDPCGNLLSGTQRQSSKVSSVLAKASYSPGNFYSAILGDSEFNAQSVNPLENPSSGTREQLQKISPPQGDVGGPQCISYCTRPSESEGDADPSQIQPAFESLPSPNEGRLMNSQHPFGQETDRKGVTKPNKILSNKKLPLLQRKAPNPSSRRTGHPKKIPALEGIDKEGASQGMKPMNNESSAGPLQTEDSSTIQLCHGEVRLRTHFQALATSQQSGTELLSRKEPHPLQHAPSRKRSRRKKQTVADADLASNIAEPMEGSKEKCPLTSLKLAQDQIPISVCRLSCDRFENGAAAADLMMCIKNNGLTAVDILAQICHEFAKKPPGSANHVMQSSSANPLKAELKRKLKISEECGRNFDTRLFQLDTLENQIASSTQADEAQASGKISQAELEVHEPETNGIDFDKLQNEEIRCAIQEPEHLTTLLESIETAVIRGRELDQQRPANAASHHDHMLDIRSLEMMLQHAASGVRLGEITVTGFSERLKEFNGILEEAFSHVRA